MSRLSRFIHFYTDEDDGNKGKWHTTVAGAIATFITNLVNPLRLTATFTPIQDLHGYDNPWPAGGGVNKLDPSKKTVDSNGYRWRWYYTDGFTLIANQAYTFSVSGTSQLITLYIIEKETNTTLVSGSTGGKITYTPTDSVVVFFQAYRGEVIQDANNFQLELGSSATTFAPYSNLCPISGHTGATVKGTGGNLLDETNYPVVDGKWISGGSGGVVTQTGYSCINTFVPCSHLKGQTITLNKRPSGTTPGFAFYSSNDESTFISGIKNNGETEGQSWTITVPDNANYMRFSVQSGARNIQINIGSSALPYSHYTLNTNLSISWQSEAGTVYAGTLEIKEDGSGVLTANHSKLIKNTSTMDNDENFPGWKNAGVRELMGTGIDRVYESQTLNVGTAFAVNTTYDILYLPKGTGNSRYPFTQTEWIALAQDVEVLIPLATPLTYNLTAEQVGQIMTLQGTNNVWVEDADEITVEFLA